VLAALTVLADEKAVKKAWNFDGDAPGAAPKGLRGEVGEWKVVADPSAPSKGNVLLQSAKSSGPTFNVALVEEPGYRDLDLTVKLKAVDGKIDQGGGVIWRAKDTKNYYIARYNPLEDNFRVYKVENGKRTQLKTADIDKRVEGWHTLRVTMKGDQIECSLDGKKLLEAKDSTFPDAGEIGLWTKADAQTHFDDLSVELLAGG